jgi:hypothetical protein
MIRRMDDPRKERLARNEASAREINEQIEEAHGDRSPVRYLRVVCECGLEACERVIAVTAGEYEQVRSDPVQFLIVREHLIEELERIVRETERFVVVAKREGAPAQTAEQNDPRS